MKRTALFSLAFIIATTALANDWPRWRGPDGTGISEESKWDVKAVNTPKIAWTKALGPGHSAATVADGKLYTMGNKEDKDIVYCLDAKTGKEIWTFEYAQPAGNYAGPRATPVVDNDRLYTFSRNGDLYCIDTKKGKELWHANLSEHGAQNIRWGLSSSPLIVNNMVIVNVCEHGVAFDKKTGAKIWASPSAKTGYASPVLHELDGKQILLMFGLKHVYGVAPDTGKELWSYEWITKYNINASDPIPFKDKVFIGSGYNRGCTLLDIGSGVATKSWESSNLRTHLASAVLIKGYLYAIDGNTGGGVLRCVEIKTGTEKWSNEEGYENLMAADGKLITIDKAGDLSVVEATPAGFKELARGNVLGKEAKNWTAPVLANGMIYCRNAAGTMVCVDVRK
jgi:outer membrane protein assembly factor BamB